MKSQKYLNYNEKVSIIVAAYNVDRYIRQCIKSLLNQTYQNIEIICIDDCSMDNTKDELYDIQKSTNNILVYSNDHNEGVSEVRNKGIDLASGKWICFVDGDDYAAPTMIEELVEKANKEKSEVVIGNYYSVGRKGIKHESFYNGCCSVLKEQLQKDAILGIRGLSTSVGVPWGKLYSRNMIIKNNIKFVTGLKRMQDMIFNLYIFQIANRISILEDPVYYYRLHNESSVNSYDGTFIDTAEKIMVEIESFTEMYSKEWREVNALKRLQLIIEATKLFCIRKSILKDRHSIIENVCEARCRLFKVDSNVCKVFGRTIKEKVMIILLRNEMYLTFAALCMLKNSIHISVLQK